MRKIKTLAAFVAATAALAAMTIPASADASYEYGRAAIRLTTAGGLEATVNDILWDGEVTAGEEEIDALCIGRTIDPAVSQSAALEVDVYEAPEGVTLDITSLSVDINIPYNEIVGKFASATVWLDGEESYSVDAPELIDNGDYVSIDLLTQPIEGFEGSIGVMLEYEVAAATVEEEVEVETLVEAAEEAEEATGETVEVVVETKDSPDTGIADVAAVAGTALAAGAAILISKKRRY